ncbi:MAG: glycoside hydrolase family 2 TIM barrel-domain containing protein [Opitutaceae bacterium]
MSPMKRWMMLAVGGSLAAIAAAAPSPRQRLTMDFGWKFMLGDPAGAEAPAFDDSSWQAVDLPHDWSIHLAFDPAAPSGRAGAFLPTGIGWYRRIFRVPQADAGRLVEIEFDGIRERGEVWINGHVLGQRPYGYTSVVYDMTPYLNFGENDNVLAVRVDNSHQPNSRWYAGSGIYRHAWLLVTNHLHIPLWGTQVTTPEVTDDRALVSAAITVVNGSDKREDFTLDSMLIDSGGFGLQTAHSLASLQPGTSGTAVQAFGVGQPHLWSIERPEKYTLRTTLRRVGSPDEIVDEVETPFGIRSIAWDVDRGFILNGVPTKLNGVCLHADGGSVGVAVPIGVWVRRLNLLKAMGCNAIRVSHNPPDPEFLDLCDNMGFCVMDEAYDEWEIAKSQTPQGCHLFFDEWHVRDTTDFIRRDRNHPSVVIWSAGNEIPEQVTVAGTAVLKDLVDIFHREDPTRPVTCACDRVYAEPVSGRPEFMALLDVAGYNYVDRWRSRANTYYDTDRRQFPDRKFIGTESVAMSGARGEYGDPFPPIPAAAVDVQPAPGAPAGVPPIPPEAAAIRRARQGSQPRLPVEALWKFVRVHDYVAGDFMWTGIDYLGEGGVGSTSGMLDTCGFRKDGYYFYQSQWTTQPMVHVFPHWNWQGHEGRRMTVYAYSNCDTVELFINGRSQGVRGYEFPREGSEGGWNSLPARAYEVHTTDDLHLTWDVAYEPGVLRAVGRRAGRIVAEDEIATTGSPVAVKLATDLPAGIADGQCVIHAVVHIVDDQGRTVPTADNEVTFDVQGEARIIGVDSGNLSMQESFQGTRRHAFHGLCLAILQMTRKTGKIQITARAQGLREATMAITSGEGMPAIGVERQGNPLALAEPPGSAYGDGR